MNFAFLLIRPDTPICWINCNPVDDLPDNIPRKKLYVSLAFAPFLKTCDTVLEFLGGLKLCRNVLLCFFLLITLLELIAEQDKWLAIHHPFHIVFISCYQTFSEFVLALIYFLLLRCQFLNDFLQFY